MGFSKKRSLRGKKCKKKLYFILHVHEGANFVVFQNPGWDFFKSLGEIFQNPGWDFQKPWVEFFLPPPRHHRHGGH